LEALASAEDHSSGGGREEVVALQTEQEGLKKQAQL